MKTINKEERLYAIAKNLSSYMSFLASHSSGQEVIRKPGATIISAKIDNQIFNHVIDCNLSDENAEKIVQEVHDYFRKRKISFSWWLGPLHTPTHLKEILKAHRCSYQTDASVLYLDLKEKVFFDPTLRIERVHSLEAFKRFYELQVKARGLKNEFHEVYLDIPNKIFQEKQPVEYFIGFIDTLPVTCGSLSLSGNIAGIFSLATRPDHWKKGYATSMLHFLLNRASKSGYAIAYLFASQEKKSFYEKKGFSEYCRYQEFSHY